jgi:hypothetical protein
MQATKIQHIIYLEEQAQLIADSLLVRQAGTVRMPLVVRHTDARLRTFAAGARYV